MTTSPTNSSNPRVEAIRESVRQSYAALNQLIDGPLAALDPQKLYQSPPDDEWTIMQNLAHVVEFMPYWADEITKLVARPGQNFGRTMQDERRLQFIQDNEHDTLEQIRAQLPASYTHLQSALETLTDSDLALTGVHVRYGEKSLDWFIEDFVTKHLSDHVEQIRQAWEAVS